MVTVALGLSADGRLESAMAFVKLSGYDGGKAFYVLASEVIAVVQDSGKSRVVMRGGAEHFAATSASHIAAAIEKALGSTTVEEAG
jgi:hypothetical protein